MAPEDLNQTAAGIPPAGAAGKPAKKQESWLEVVKTIVYALLIAGVIRSFIFQPFNIPSGSMIPTCSAIQRGTTQTRCVPLSKCSSHPRRIHAD